MPHRGRYGQAGRGVHLRTAGRVSGRAMGTQDNRHQVHFGQIEAARDCRHPDTIHAVYKAAAAGKKLSSSLTSSSFAPRRELNAQMIYMLDRKL